MDAFSDPQAVARYAEAPPRLVPGFASLQKMAMLLLAEQAPDDARVLVLGAGGGLEIKAFAEAQPGWRFDGVDPSGEMLRLAAITLGPLASRTSLHQGLIDVAPDGPFDAATCILTLHFVEPEERLWTLKEIRRRLKPDAPFVVAHHSFPQDAGERERWLARYAAYAAASGVEPAKAKDAQGMIATRLSILSPEEDEKLLRDAGFDEVTLFYVGFTFRGWVARA
ncbi:class I SAM-dependent methyltransferase [Bosea sp. BK604]|uniref:class I SAM-dependent methyltransferase n=1 Tax=Bosea sp. BK604 TaxID=2512180 RepID=UPI001045ECF9|nr:class I SAM-dependent methyltransferase [Bosea sp. BK604]TCR64002.1 tRNA (cmo5U34)-methyltransferase [Bosea sp. BK604]